eukprot:36382_1
MLSKTNYFPTIPKRLCNIHHRANIHTKFAIVGGGTAGMNVAGQLLSSNTCSPRDITVFEPRNIHYYQPGFTMVAGGILGNDNTEVRRQFGGLIQKPMNQIFNSNINFINDSIGLYDADNNRLYTYNTDNEFTYDILIMCTGIELRYDLIEGLEDALNDPHSNVGSMYDINYALKMNKVRTKFKGGKVIATQPTAPFKCAGAPQKFIYLTEHKFRTMGIRNDIESFKFYTDLPVMFGVKKYNRELTKLVEKKGIIPMYQKQLIKVDNNKNLAYFKDNNTDEIIIDSYDFLHVSPIQKANKVTADASFSDKNGFVDVNQFTLQSKKYENIFGIGDCNNCMNPKTAAAIFSQTPTVIDNINKYLKKEKLINSFDGYGSCPIFVGDDKLMLAEFTYGGKPKEFFDKFYIDQGYPRKAFWYLKRYIFPFAYWNFASKGMWYGTNAIFKPKLKSIN